VAAALSNKAGAAGLPAVLRRFSALLLPVGRGDEGEKQRGMAACWLLSSVEARGSGGPARFVDMAWLVVRWSSSPSVAPYSFSSLARPWWLDDEGVVGCGVRLVELADFIGASLRRLFGGFLPPGSPSTVAVLRPSFLPSLLPKWCVPSGGALAGHGARPGVTKDGRSGSLGPDRVLHPTPGASFALLQDLVVTCNIYFFQGFSIIVSPT
jgi:hypothetical protein